MELKPCPFCNESKLIVAMFKDTSTYWVRCGNCTAEGPVSQTSREDAATLWNHRSLEYVKSTPLLATDIIAEMDRIIQELPCAMEYETDARDTWPSRWVALREYLTANIIREDIIKLQLNKKEEGEMALKRKLDRLEVMETVALEHLVVLHRVLYGTIDEKEAIKYLHRHLRDDADLADMGRPLKYQYQGVSDGTTEKEV